MFDDNNAEIYLDLTLGETFRNKVLAGFNELLRQQAQALNQVIPAELIPINENNTTRFDREIHNMDNFCELDLTKNIQNIPKDHRVIIETINKQIDLDDAIHDWVGMSYKTASYAGRIHCYYKNSLRLLIIKQETFKPDFKGDAINFVKDRIKNPKLFR